MMLMVGARTMLMMVMTAGRVVMAMIMIVAMMVVMLVCMLMVMLMRISRRRNLTIRDRCGCARLVRPGRHDCAPAP